MIAGITNTLVSDTTIMYVIATGSGTAMTKELTVPALPANFKSASLVINDQSYDPFGGSENPININANVYRNGLVTNTITITATKLHPSIIGKNIIWRADNVENHVVTEIYKINEN